jgi:hypothetical protein
VSVRAPLSDWSSSHARSPSGAFESVQRVELPAPVVEHSEAGARHLGELYWRELERWTLRVVRTRSARGSTVVHALGVGPVLLRFGEPELTVSDRVVGCRYPIRGGLLARAAVGSISFAQSLDDGVELRTAIAGFFPRLAARRLTGVLYLHVQARLHVALARSYFARLWRESRR